MTSPLAAPPTPLHALGRRRFLKWATCAAGYLTLPILLGARALAPRDRAPAPLHPADHLAEDALDDPYASLADPGWSA